MSDGTGNPAGLFSVKGMVALVCHRLGVVFFPLVPKNAVRPLVALCNNLEDTRQCASCEALCAPIHEHRLTRFMIDRSQVEEQVPNLTSSHETFPSTVC